MLPCRTSYLAAVVLLFMGLLQTTAAADDFGGPRRYDSQPMSSQEENQLRQELQTLERRQTAERVAQIERFSRDLAAGVAYVMEKLKGELQSTRRSSPASMGAPVWGPPTAPSWNPGRRWPALGVPRPEQAQAQPESPLLVQLAKALLHHFLVPGSILPAQSETPGMRFELQLRPKGPRLLIEPIEEGAERSRDWEQDEIAAPLPHPQTAGAAAQRPAAPPQRPNTFRF